MVALDDSRDAGPRRPAVERHPLGRRRRASSSPRWAGRRPAPTPIGSVLVASFTVDQAALAARPRARRAPPRWPQRAAAPRLRLAPPAPSPAPTPFTDRGDASGTGYFDDRDGRVAPRPAPSRRSATRSALPRVVAPGAVAARDARRRAWSPAAPATTWAPPSAWPSARRRASSRSAPPASPRPSAPPRSPTAPAWSPASPTPAAASCPMVDHDERRRDPRPPGPVARRRPRRAGRPGPAVRPRRAAASTLLPYYGGERTPNRPDAVGTWTGLTAGHHARRPRPRGVRGAALLARRRRRPARRRAPASSPRRAAPGRRRDPQPRRCARSPRPSSAGPSRCRPPGEYVALGAARQAAWALSGAAEPPTWPARRHRRSLEADPTPHVREVYADLRDRTAPWTDDGEAPHEHRHPQPDPRGQVLLRPLDRRLAGARPLRRRRPAPPMDTVHALEKLAELGAYGVNFHDDDVIPFGSDDDDPRRGSSSASRRASPTPASWSPRRPPTSSPTRSSRPAAFTNNDRDIRRFALRKVMRNIDLAAELGAKIYVAWGGREGAEYGASQDIAGRARPDARRPSTSSASTSPTRATTCASRSSPSPTSRAATSCCRPIGHALAFIETLDRPELVGVNPEIGHEEMAGMNAAAGYAQALWQGKLFHIDLNGQNGPKYDQDLRFGAGNVRGAFWVVDTLLAGGYDGPVHFDYKPARTEDEDGVWVVGRGLHAQLPDPAREGARLPRRPRGAGRARGRALPELAEPTLGRRRGLAGPARRPSCPTPRRSPRRGLRLRAARPARPRAPVRRPRLSRCSRRPRGTEGLRRQNTAACCARCAGTARPRRAELASAPAWPRPRSASIVADLERPGRSPRRRSRPARSRAAPDDRSACAGGGFVGLGLELNVDYVAAAVLDLGRRVRHRETRPSGRARPDAAASSSPARSRRPVARTTGSSARRSPCRGWSRGDDRTVAWAPNLHSTAPASPSGSARPRRRARRGQQRRQLRGVRRVAPRRRGGRGPRALPDRHRRHRRRHRRATASCCAAARASPARSGTCPWATPPPAAAAGDAAAGRRRSACTRCWPRSACTSWTPRCHRRGGGRRAARTDAASEQALEQLGPRRRHGPRRPGQRPRPRGGRAGRLLRPARRPGARARPRAPSTSGSSRRASVAPGAAASTLGIQAAAPRRRRAGPRARCSPARSSTSPRPERTRRVSRRAGRDDVVRAPCRARRPGRRSRGSSAISAAPSSTESAPRPGRARVTDSQRARAVRAPSARRSPRRPRAGRASGSSRRGRPSGG